jgi:hypothetical protein
VAWLIFLSMRFGRKAAAAPDLGVVALAIVFGVPALALAALWVFFRIRHLIAHRPTQRRGNRDG